MNDKIKELVKQVSVTNYDEDGGELLPILIGSEIDKFAELIIKECIDNLKVWECDSRNHVSHMLKQHFGV